MKKRFESNGDTIRNMNNEELSELPSLFEMVVHLNYKE